MDEVDNIIIHSLRQIKCNIDEDVRSLSSFTPELLVESVSKCLNLIRPGLVLPKTLPPGMAQRFSVGATLAEACVSVGFRGDIGYQTFLYSNVTEVRRVFMFLIERLPKETEKLPLTQPLDKLSALENEIYRNISIQLRSPWIPQYCNKSGIRKYESGTLSLNAESTKFQPQLNLNIPHSLTNTQSISSAVHNYWLKRSPSVFQQTNSQTLSPSIIHKNDIEIFNDKHSENIEQLIKTISTQYITSLKDDACKKLLPNTLDNSVQKLALNTDNSINKPEVISAKLSTKQLLNQSSTLQSTNAIEKLDIEIERLKKGIDELLSNRKVLQANILKVKELRSQQDENLNKLKDERKIKERTCILLENPEGNVSKMESLVAGTNERMKKLTEQWEEHRQPLTEALEKSKAKCSNKSTQNKAVMEQAKIIRIKSTEISEDLKNKTALHAQLINELQKVDKTISRNAYTSRILEIIGNIRKQKNDIDKVLRDTRELQKEISNITGQLDRQFTVTDDLLFKTAKRDEHSKKAYKLLATLHSDCGDLVGLVQETGAVMREVRDLEDQIENEKARNISTNLEKITFDLKHMERESKDLQEKIRKVENQITQG